MSMITIESQQDRQIDIENQQDKILNVENIKIQLGSANEEETIPLKI